MNALLVMCERELRVIHCYMIGLMASVLLCHWLKMKLNWALIMRLYDYDAG